MSASALQQGVMSYKRHDAQGREICPIHGKQLYGYLTLTRKGPQKNEVADTRAEYLAIYGEHKTTGKLGSSDIPDIKDNRDPTELGNQILAKLNGKGSD